MAEQASPHKCTIDPAFNNDGQNELKVPGFGLPLDYMPELDGERFRYFALDFAPPRLVAREVSMLNLMNAITDKPEWFEKVYKQDIVAKWKTEATQHELMSDAAFEWCIQELQDKAEFYKAKGFVPVLDSASVCVKSDRLITSELQRELKAAVEPLLQSPTPDWHPNSNDQVLNLIHPSLYPLVYGQSRVLKTGLVGLQDCIRYAGKGDVVPVPDLPKKDDSRSWQYKERGTTIPELWSHRFQWLPSEVRFRGDSGTEVNFISCINNLHPARNMALYRAIEKVMSFIVPVWNSVLVYGDEGRLPQRIKTYGVEILNGEEPEWSREINQTETVSDELRAKVREYMALPNRPDYEVLHPDDSDFNEDEHVPDNWEELEQWDLWQAVCAKTKQVRQYVHPEAGEAYSYEDWKAGKVDKAVIEPAYNGTMSKHEYHSIHLENDFRQKGLQVIVKLASIELTPDKSSYEGGSWHVEGMLNEHIAATAIYYYDVQNTTESKIRFRQDAVLPDEELSYEQNDHEPIAEIFGCESKSLWDTSADQELGSITTPEGRLIAFPNTLQHRVEPFELLDKTQSGHRRFLVLWLVDPHYRVMSTANIPPQQHEWWAEEAKLESGLPLPLEVVDMIMQRTDHWPMGLDQAKELRLELMAERTTYADTVDGCISTYNLCEH